VPKQEGGKGVAVKRGRDLGGIGLAVEELPLTDPAAVIAAVETLPAVTSPTKPL
jgi:hypothetical protein